MMPQYVPITKSRDAATIGKVTQNPADEYFMLTVCTV
jgi:hypothetical protein